MEKKKGSSKKILKSVKSIDSPTLYSSFGVV